MSFNRENVTWQSPDGTWSLGFYTAHDVGDPSDDDYDPEWDVEYDFRSFEWVSSGHPNMERAWRSWDGANPGGTSSVPFKPQYEEEVARLDDMAAVACEQARNRGGRHGRFVHYEGPRRERTVEAIREEMASLDAELARDAEQIAAYRRRGDRLVIGGHQERVERRDRLAAALTARGAPLRFDATGKPAGSAGQERVRAGVPAGSAGQERVRAGVPAGGQFAARRRPEPNSRL